MFSIGQGLLTLHSMIKLIQRLIVVLLTCKNEDLIKNEGPRVLTTLYIDFSDAHYNQWSDLV